MDQRFLCIETFDALSEPETCRIGAQDVEIARFACLDRRRDATGDRIVLSEILTLLDVDGPHEEQRHSDEDNEKEDGHDRIEQP